MLGVLLDMMVSCVYVVMGEQWRFESGLNNEQHQLHTKGPRKNKCAFYSVTIPKADMQHKLGMSKEHHFFR